MRCVDLCADTHHDVQRFFSRVTDETKDGRRRADRVCLSLKLVARFKAGGVAAWLASLLVLVGHLGFWWLVG